MLCVTKKNTYEWKKDEVREMIDWLGEKGEEGLKEVCKKWEDEINEIVDEMRMGGVDEDMHLGKVGDEERGRGI